MDRRFPARLRGPALKTAVWDSAPILVRTVILPQAGLERTIAEIEALGGLLVGADVDADPVFDLATFLLPGNMLNPAAALPGVYTISPVPMDGGDRGEMSDQINVGNYDGSNMAFTGYKDWLSSVGLSGNGVVIANVDSGIDQNHPDLVNRMLPCSGSTCGGLTTSDHGTHTAGIMAGDGSSGSLDAFGFLRGLGMAPGANLIEQVLQSHFYGDWGYVDPDDPILPEQCGRLRQQLGGRREPPRDTTKTPGWWTLACAMRTRTYRVTSSLTTFYLS